MNKFLEGNRIATGFAGVRIRKGALQPYRAISGRLSLARRSVI